MSIIWPATTPMPVMVYFHEGFFRTGSSNDINASVLSGFNDVIVVTVNYRLSAFGFLSTGDAACPGNFGLWDQHEAINWVHNNIESFGGNKTSVTIFGNSVGSASTFYQSTFPENKHKIQRMIGQSGSSLAPFSFAEQDDLWQYYNGFFASSTGCNNANSETFLECLRELPFLDIVQALSLNDGNFHVRPQFLPMMDGDFIKVKPMQLFSSDPAVAFAERDMFGSVDVLTGFNDDDGIARTFVNLYSLLTQYPTFTLTNGIPGNLVQNVIIPTVVTEYFSTADDYVALGSAVLAKYFGLPPDLTDNLVNRDTIFDITTDGFITQPIVVSAAFHSMSSKSTFLYKLVGAPSYESLPWVDGAKHVVDVDFIFGFKKYSQNVEPNAVEIQLSRKMMAAWARFAAKGDPSDDDFTWNQFDEGVQKYTQISITDGSFSHQMVPLDPNTLAFWSVVIPSL